MLTQNYTLVACSDVVIDRAARQRREFNTLDLEDSMKRLGVINPIIITKDNKLVAGERRLTACLRLGLAHIPARFSDDLDELELQQIELEENLKRKELPWRDEVAAVARIHAIYAARDPDWTQERTSDSIGVSGSVVSKYLRVSRDLDNPRLEQAASAEAAFNVLNRLDQRAEADAMADIVEASTAAFGPAKPVPKAASVDVPTATPAPPPPAPIPILQADFHNWVQTYTGPAFNFIHCDFPYGINVFGGNLSGRQKWNTYSDDADIYWQLIRTFCKNLDRIMAPSAHLMFWFSMEYYTETLEAFAELAPDLVFQRRPLTWVKSDNVGIISDPKRGPRNIVETALMATRGDRYILRSVANGVFMPTSKEHHPSTKPEPVLRHFFQMFVDEHSRVLDPTCGGGSAIRVADEMKAKVVLGLERDQEHVENATKALKAARVLRSAGK